MEQNTQNADLVRLIRERFEPLTKLSGPLHAGTLEIGPGKGPLYLDMLSRWLWLAVDESGQYTNQQIPPGPLSDALVATYIPPSSLLRSLLNAGQYIFTRLGEFLAKIERSDADREALLRFYLNNPNAVVIDVFAVNEVLGHINNRAASTI